MQNVRLDLAGRLRQSVNAMMLQAQYGKNLELRKMKSSLSQQSDRLARNLNSIAEIAKYDSS